MKRTLTTLALGAMLMAACAQHDRDADIAKINQLEMELSSIDADVASTDKAEQLLSHYRSFATRYPDDSLAPVYLTHAADLCIGMDSTELALTLIDSVMGFSGYEDLGGAAFLRGYAYEMAGRYDEAREAYQNFVDQYPDHYLASDTRKALPYVGLSPEAMFEAMILSVSAENLTGE